jgi:ketosteroid isomerase-like protein
MDHVNVDLVAQVYGAYMTGDREMVERLLSPDIMWHNSGYDPSAGTIRGVDSVLEFLMGEDHMEDYGLEVVDMLASDDRVAIVARASGRRGDRSIVNDFVQLVRIVDGRVAEVWNYYWDQRAVVEFMTGADAMN